MYGCSNPRYVGQTRTTCKCYWKSDSKLFAKLGPQGSVTSFSLSVFKEVYLSIYMYIYICLFLYILQKVNTLVDVGKAMQNAFSIEPPVYAKPTSMLPPQRPYVVFFSFPSHVHVLIVLLCVLTTTLSYTHSLL